MGSKPSSSTTSTNKIDPQLMEMYMGNYNLAMDYFNQPYNPYPDQKIADMTPDQITAMDAVHANYDAIMGSGYRERLNALLGTDAQST